MGVLIYDDRDAAITYSGADWSLAGSEREFNSTTSWTATEGATAIVNFTGTTISVYGTIAGGLRARAPRSSYSIDGGTPVEYEAELTRAVQYNVQFFQSPTLSEGTHTLTITNTGDDSAQFFLDMFMVTPLERPLLTTVTQTTTASASTAAARTVTVTQSAPSSSLTLPPSSAESDTESNPESSQTGASSKTNTGAIAGGIIGAVAFLLLLAGAFVLWRKRQQKKKKADSANDNYWTAPTNGTIVPFPPPKPTNLNTPPMSQTSLPSQPAQDLPYPTQPFVPSPHLNQYPSSISSGPAPNTSYSPAPHPTTFSAPGHAPAVPPGDLGYHGGADYEAAYSGYTQGDYNQPAYSSPYPPAQADFTNNAGYGAGGMQSQRPWNANSG